MLSILSCSSAHSGQKNLSLKQGQRKGIKRQTCCSCSRPFPAFRMSSLQNLHLSSPVFMLLSPPTPRSGTPIRQKAMSADVWLPRGITPSQIERQLSMGFYSIDIHPDESLFAVTSSCVYLWPLSAVFSNGGSSRQPVILRGMSEAIIFFLHISIVAEREQLHLSSDISGDPAPLKEHSAPVVTCARFSPNGKFVASCGDAQDSVVVWQGKPPVRNMWGIEPTVFGRVQDAMPEHRRYTAATWTWTKVFPRAGVMSRGLPTSQGISGLRMARARQVSSHSPLFVDMVDLTWSPESDRIAVGVLDQLVMWAIPPFGAGLQITMYPPPPPPSLSPSRVGTLS